MATRGKPGHGEDGAPGRPASPSASGIVRSGVKAALARWVLRQRRGLHDRGGKWPTPQDEATHPFDGRRRFAEDYTFVGLQRGLAVMLRLEWLPGRDAHRVWVMLFRGDRAWTLPGGQKIVRRKDSDRWRAAGLELDCVTPMQEWSIRFTGRLVPAPSLAVHPFGSEGLRCSVDLQFVADGSPFAPGRDDDPSLLAAHLGRATWEPGLVRAVRRVQNRGYVQTGQLIGTVVQDDEFIPLRALGMREHTWGVRDWGASDRAFRCFVAPPHGSSAWMHHAEFPFVTLEGGFVGGSPIRAVAVQPDPADASVPDVVRITADHAGGLLDVRGEMRARLELVVDGRGEIGLGYFETDDGGVGFWGGQRRVLPRP